MDMFIWDEKYKVGILEFDEQHKKIISIINMLYEKMKSGKEKEAISVSLEELIEYINYHFEAEEKLFSEYAYHHKGQHMKEHEKIRNKIIEFKLSFDNGQVVVDDILVNFLKEWLDYHIIENDKKYESFFNKKGIK